MSILRAAFRSACKETVEQALAQHLEQGDGERALHPPVLVKSQQSTEEESHPETQGRIAITSERVLYWCDAESDGSLFDLVVPAECIDLHALSSTDDETDTIDDNVAPPVSNLYLQLRSDCESSDPVFVEWTLVPICDSTEESAAALHSLFEALSQLISLHPIDPNLDAEGDDDDGDEMVIAPSLVMREATPYEREAMLDHLDSILVVPSDLEQTDVVEGQFDDAEEEETVDDADDDVDALL